jgi:hypothetical protein
MTVRGDIFHNPSFRFHDGVIGNKLLVLLNTPDKSESCLFVTTTSKKKDKPSTTGCFKHRHTGMFFLPKTSTFFIEDTWIILFKPYEIKINDVNQKNGWNKIGSLSENVIKQIIDCLFTHHEDDISELHESWLRPPITASIHKLKEKFDSERK